MHFPLLQNNQLERSVRDLNKQLDNDQRQYEASLNNRDAELRKMRDESQQLLIELQNLLDTKQLLDTEIAIYRKMLEGEESRANVREMVEDVVRQHTIQQQQSTDTQKQVFESTFPHRV